MIFINSVKFMSWMYFDGDNTGSELSRNTLSSKRIHAGPLVGLSVASQAHRYPICCLFIVIIENSLGLYDD